jgi:ATP-dependent helicase/nuclease subunit B
MTVERIFTGWDEPVTEQIRRYLIPKKPKGPVDLGGLLIIVPTRKAERRLREVLARYCAQYSTALLSPLIVTPSFFIRTEQEDAVAGTMTELVTWCDVLQKADLTEYPGLFPVPVTAQDHPWALRMADMIQQLRAKLVEGELCLARVWERHGSELQEAQRWQDLARLEQIYLEHLRKKGLEDSAEMMLKRALCSEVPADVNRIVLAAVPDPSPLALRCLSALSEQLPVTALIHAPESMADTFDAWGRPLESYWSHAPIEVPDPDENILLTSTPESQARTVLRFMAEETDRFKAGDTALGVPDASLVPFLQAELEEQGLQAFDPAGKCLADHPMAQFVTGLAALYREESYAAFRSLVRHPDVLRFLCVTVKTTARVLLEELDKFQQAFLPASREGMRKHLRSGQQLSPLEQSFKIIESWMEELDASPVSEALIHILRMLYGERRLNPQRPSDKDFIEAAMAMNHRLREFGTARLEEVEFGKANALELLVRCLKDERFFPDPFAGDIDLEGWLELAWNDAPFMILTGMNEGIVPDTRPSDMFLPNSLKRQLNLRHDEDRYARDVFLLSGLIESRRRNGRIVLLAGKTNASGDPLKPSRLFFHCSDEELPRRARRLFSDPPEQKESYAPTISFKLDVRPPETIEVDLKRLRVTQFHDFLTCPFRFYLKHVLGMADLSDLKVELDDMEFGTMLHYALEQMARDDSMRSCRSTEKLCTFLDAQAEDWVAGRYGSRPPLAVRIQLESARKRLHAAARVQAGMVEEGWEIVDQERKIESTLAGMKITGTIDRIDRHTKTGRWRILDYKTSDKSANPSMKHWATPSDEDLRTYNRLLVGDKEKRWVDLQLPLYDILCPDLPSDQVEFGYFNLPKAVSETGISLWSPFEPNWLKSARACAEGVIQDIQKRRYWPPTSKMAYDDYEALFHAKIPDCIKLEEFKAFMMEAER